MISKLITISNPSGLHLRPAGVLAQTASNYKSEVLIEHQGKRIVAKSVLNIMAAGIKTGSEVTLICDGPDENEAMEDICQVIKNGLGEQMA